MDENRPIPSGCSIGVIVVFITVVLGLCALVVFIYNLPVIFPPVGGTHTTVGMATLGAPPLITEAPAVSPTLNPLPSSPPPSFASATPLPSLTPTLVAAPSFTSTPLPPTPLPAATAALVPPATPTAPATATSARGHIIFVADQNGSSIMEMNADGSGQTLLVPHSGAYSDRAPAISPDGRRLAFSSNRDKQGRDDIYLINTDGTHLDQITNMRKADSHSPSWFPDGHHLAFTSNRGGRWQAYTMRDNGKDVSRLFDTKDEVVSLAVAPDGSAIAYTCGDDVCLADPDGSNRRSLVKNGLPKDHLVWSPGSNLLAFTQHDQDGMSAYVSDLKGNARQFIPNASVAAWSPDGQRLVFSSERDDAPALYTFDLTTGQIVRVSDARAAHSLSVWIP